MAERIREGRPCHIFEMDDVHQAWDDRQWEIAEDYGGECGDHFLYEWDEGCRMLYRCEKCGGYALGQHSEFHGMEKDGYYHDFFPVSGPAEAEELNRRYSGDDIRDAFHRRNKRFLMITNGSTYWSRGEK